MTQNTFGGFHANCQRCNTRFPVDPPGRDYIEILESECPRGDSMTTHNFCPSCEFRNPIIWDRDHNRPFKRDPESDLKLAGVD
jgi:hypothetical protein